ncbi:MAG: PSD1 and planctomycete cytochrome C domain-containing protein [Planctomycetota bacterium]|nr:PSD1 and planctomycete cytochrome C domain-containing protein [Planctomycetota bacterium]
MHHRQANTIRRSLACRVQFTLSWVCWCMAVWCITGGPTIVQGAESVSAEHADFFESKVRPLLAERCMACHGEKKQWASLRLDSAAAMHKGGESGPILVAGKPDESELISRITSDDESTRMPPEKSGEPLSAEQVKILRHWIELGAPWPATSPSPASKIGDSRKTHWAFQPIKFPPIPAVKQAELFRNPIDAFILQKLDQNNLSYSPEADRRTLIRRATFDLTGLPPTTQEIADFVNDKSYNAYEKLIDRLLESPRYGEQWGRYWLDVARYSDTKGYVYGREERFFVNSSHYRDWVIRSFNEDLPYDQFLLYQLAADQSAKDKPEHLAAMGFLTLNRRFLGVAPDFYDDRIDVVTRGMLGLTVGCARCHDHKFDPIPTTDYYSLYGIFQNCEEKQLPIPVRPGVAQPDDKITAGLKERQQKLAEGLANNSKQTAERIRKNLVTYLNAQRELDKYPELVFSQITGPDDILPGIVRRWEIYLKRQINNPVFAHWHQYAKLSASDFSVSAIPVTGQLRNQSTKSNRRIAAAFETAPASPAEVAERYAKVLTEIDQLWIKNCEAAKQAKQPIPTALPDPDDEALRQVLYGIDSPCVIPLEGVVNTEFHWDTGTVVALWNLQSEVDRWILGAASVIPHAVVLVDRQTIIEPQVFRRGNPENKGEIIPRRWLEVLSKPDQGPFKTGSGRLELAQEIISTENPLTSRVWVNRVWEHHFGSGLVTTPSDFGTRASPPSHPELLDWLSAQFMQNGWSTKLLHRQIMLSTAYRQSSRGPTDEATRQSASTLDPENKLLWRMNARRLNFEQFRDSLLTLSGELDLTMTGRGVDLESTRRTVYTTVDRQFLPTIMSVFDFANPDLHTPHRAESTIPQQALFFMNSPFVANRAKFLAKSIPAEICDQPEACAKRLYSQILRRDPTGDELSAATDFLTEAEKTEQAPAFLLEESRRQAWSYGHGEFDVKKGKLGSFQLLPHFTGQAWQASAAFPDPQVGQVSLNATGGIVSVIKHLAVIRRWTATTAGTISIQSEVRHKPKDVDGVRCWIVSSRLGVVRSDIVNDRQVKLAVESLEVEPGDTIDFVTDSGEGKHDEANKEKVAIHDNFDWSISIKQLSLKQSGTGKLLSWNSEADFTKPRELSPLAQLAHVLLLSNEVMFVD